MARDEANIVAVEGKIKHTKNILRLSDFVSHFFFVFVNSKSFLCKFRDKVVSRAVPFNETHSIVDCFINNGVRCLDNFH